MKNILFIVGIVITLAAAYVSYNNTQKVAEIAQETEKFEAQKKNIQASITDQTKKLDTLKVELKSVQEEVAEEEVKLDKAQENERQLARQLEKKQAELEGLDAKLERVDELKEEIATTLEGIGVDDVSEVAAVIDRIEGQVDDKRTELESVEAINEKLADKVAQDTEAIAKSRAELATIRKRIANNGLEMRVEAVNSEWDFAVVGAGSKNSNLSPNAELLVIRGGELVGRLFAKTIEANQTVCDIDTDFRVNTIRQGDQVILREPVAK